MTATWLFVTCCLRPRNLLFRRGGNGGPCRRLVSGEHAVVFRLIALGRLRTIGARGAFRVRSGRFHVQQSQVAFPFDPRVVLGQVVKDPATKGNQGTGDNRLQCFRVFLLVCVEGETVDVSIEQLPLLVT